MKESIVLFIILVLSVSAFSQSPQNYATNPPDFDKLSYENALNAVYDEDNLIGRGAEKIGVQYINNLVHQLQYGRLSNGNKTLAIYLLGELHPTDTNSIETLIQNIDFLTERVDPKTHFSRWGYYPAEDALMKIGKPVVVPMLNHIPSENNQPRRRLMCNVLNVVLRRYLASQNEP